MKKYIFSLFLCFLPLLSHAWTNISIFAMQNKLAIDETRFKNDEAWIRFPVQQGNLSYSVSKIKFSCENKRLGMKNGYFYDAQGTMVKSEKANTVEDIIPGSFGEFVLERVCLYKKLTQLPDNEKICAINTERTLFIQHIENICANQLKLEGFVSKVGLEKQKYVVSKLNCSSTGKSKDYMDILGSIFVSYAMDISNFTLKNLTDYCNSNRSKFNQYQDFYLNFK